MPEETQSFFRRWRFGIVAGVLIVAFLVGLRGFFDYQANAPIIDPYLGPITEVSSQSPRVRQRLEQYYAKHQRQTIASKHYPWLCDEIQKLAVRDGVRKNLYCPTLYQDIYEKP